MFLPPPSAISWTHLATPPSLWQEVDGLHRNLLQVIMPYPEFSMSHTDTHTQSPCPLPLQSMSPEWYRGPLSAGYPTVTYSLYWPSWQSLTPSAERGFSAGLWQQRWSMGISSYLEGVHGSVTSISKSAAASHQHLRLPSHWLLTRFAAPDMLREMDFLWISIRSHSVPPDSHVMEMKWHPIVVVIWISLQGTMAACFISFLVIYRPFSEKHLFKCSAHF